MQSHLSILIFVPYILGSYLKRHWTFQCAGALPVFFFLYF
jgi:hypothetical protein